ncbi:MAG: LEA type 2 family protein [Deltaproteobacteria bacterium]|nr:LEA type 2 family protein [Deltaproteobacteria bacterium]
MPRSLIRFVLAITVVLIALLSAGCASKPSMKLNRAEVSGIRISLPPSIGVLMTIYVDVYNPNSYDIAIRAVRGEVLLAQRYTLPVEFRPEGEGVWLSSKTNTPIAVPVVVPAQIALAVLRDTLTMPTIPYHFKGRADVTATRSLKIESDDYSVDEDGSISRAQIDAVLRRTH